MHHDGTACTACIHMKPESLIKPTQFDLSELQHHMVGSFIAGALQVTVFARRHSFILLGVTINRQRCCQKIQAPCLPNVHT